MDFLSLTHACASSTCVRQKQQLKIIFGRRTPPFFFALSWIDSGGSSNAHGVWIRLEKITFKMSFKQWYSISFWEFIYNIFEIKYLCVTLGHHVPLSEVCWTGRHVYTVTGIWVHVGWTIWPVEHTSIFLHYEQITEACSIWLYVVTQMYIAQMAN